MGTHYQISDSDRTKIDGAFTYHQTQGDQVERYTEIRIRAKEFAMLLVSTCPPSRELSLAITALQEAVLWANASIAINEDK